MATLAARGAELASTTTTAVESASVDSPSADSAPAHAASVKHRTGRTSAGSLSFSSARYAVASSSTALTVSVTRTGGRAGAATANYSTANGTATSGTDYTTTAGTLSWSAKDDATKTFTVPILAGGAGDKSFTLELTGTTGAKLGTTTVATASIAAKPVATGSLALSSASYSLAHGASSLSVTVNRTAGSAGAATVKYATSNGTAAAGTDYTSTSGTLNWGAMDAAAKTFNIPLNAVGSGGKSFLVTLSAATGAALGTPAAATVSIAAKTVTSSALAIKVKGNQFVDQNGKTLQMRGANVSGLESVAIQGWSVSDPWGGMKPVWTALQAWKINAVRFPLNEASWLGYTCIDANGQTIDPDPGKNYRATVEQTITEANAAGLYVIVDLHWSAPGTICPTDQNWMADTDHSIAFWTSIADTFKSNPAVIFELYNEPVLADTSAGWNTWLNGGPQTTVRPGGGKNYAWTSAGMQTMLDAVRATGATNVVLCGGVSYSNVLNGFPAHIPVDPSSQLGVAWHVYSFNIYTDPSAGSLTANMLAAAGATVPLTITEVGDTDGAGQTGSFVAKIATFADTNGYSYFAWTWNDWGQTSNDLILDASGTPTIGFGTYYKQHLICRASSPTATCH